MTKKKRYLILGTFSFLLAIHCILNFFNSNSLVGLIILLPPAFGFWLMFMLGVSCSLRSIFLHLDRRILDTDQEVAMRKKGGRIAVRGTIYPDKAQISAPFSGKQCVLYEYHIFKGKKHPEAEGWAFVPSSVKTKTDRGSINLLDYPIMMVLDFYEKGITKSVTSQFIQQTRFKKLNRILTLLLHEVLALIPSLSRLLFFEPPKENGKIRTDIDYRNKNEAFCADKIEERVVALGSPVIAIGKYDSKRNALTSGWMGLRLIPDSGLSEIRESFRGTIIVWTAAGVFFTGCWLVASILMDFWSDLWNFFPALIEGNIVFSEDTTKSSFKFAEFITFWFTHGKPPVSAFPFESNLYQSIAFLSVLIFPIINVIMGFKRSIRLGKTQIGITLMIYLCFYMLLQSGMTIEYGTIEEINRSFSFKGSLFTPLKALLFMAFLGSCLYAIEFPSRKSILEKGITKISIFMLLMYSFLCLASIGLLINFVKVEFIDNKQGRGIGANDGYTTDSDRPLMKVKPLISRKQQRHPGGVGDLLVVFNSEYPCAKSLRIFVDDIESGTVDLPGRLRIPLAEGAHKIAFGSPRDHVYEITISNGKTFTAINPPIDCKPLFTSSESDFGIDLRELPLLEGANWLTQKRGELSYSSQIEVTHARDFYFKQFIQLGWQEKKEYRKVNPNFFQTILVKNNFYLICTFDRSDNSHEGWTRITLLNKGNVDARTLPRYPGAEILMKRLPPDLLYVTMAKMPEVGDFTRKELTDAGWIEIRFDDNPSIGNIIIEFVKDGIKLEADILKQNGKTYLSYYMDLYSRE